ncbi:hypothetical protein [Thioalkalivibrio sp. ALE28]|uniref:hypothetical protein n=1 Tax=Thioalkalivibrio sp. ALE28 TaxID=1158179 RepID=UPI0012DCD380|nr:hypothetical protein [Thioalkalivibrio sp. ALE28]
MFLKDWAEIWQIYRSCGAGSIARAVYAPNKLISYWYLWAATLLYLLVSLPAAFGSGAWFWFGVTGMGFAFVFLFIAVEWALQREFSSEYDAHAISRHPFGKRRLYLRYALFLNRLRERYKANQEIRTILEFADIADKPEPPFRLTEHPIVLPFITILTVLIADYIRQTEAWQDGGGLAYIFLMAMGLFFLLTLLDMVRGLKHKHSEIKRFLEWAAFDLSGNRTTTASTRTDFLSDAEKSSG